jgi:carboxylesterase
MAKIVTYNSVIPTAEPFLFLGDQTGILLVQGFTGTPKEMRTMGEYLASHGKTVLGIRLPGHATHPADMRHKRWVDWLQAVEDGYHLLRSAGRQVFIMGLSMGGILTLTAAARLPIKGAVAMSTPYLLTDDPRFPYVEYLAPFMPTMPKGTSDWHDKSMEEEHVDYPAYPTRSLAELRDLGVVMRESLPKIIVPVLLVHSRNDGGVPFENLQKIYDKLGTQDKTMLAVEHSGHVVTRDLERERIFEAALAFVNRLV